MSKITNITTYGDWSAQFKFEFENPAQAIVDWFKTQDDDCENVEYSEEDILQLISGELFDKLIKDGINFLDTQTIEAKLPSDVKLLEFKLNLEAHAFEEYRED